MNPQLPFFNLVDTDEEASVVISTIMSFGNQRERKILKPQAQRLLRAYLTSRHECCLATQTNKLLADYLRQHGDLSDQLLIFISKVISLELKKAA